MSVTKPATYVRGMRPNLGGDAQYLQDELQKVEQTLRDLVELCPQEADSPPRRPRTGMHRLAVAPWRPLGGSVDRWVYWNGTAWVALS